MIPSSQNKYRYDIVVVFIFSNIKLDLTIFPFFNKCHIWFVLSKICVSLTIDFKKFI